MGVALGQANAAWMLTEGYGYEGAPALRVTRLCVCQASWVASARGAAVVGECQLHLLCGAASYRCCP